MQSKNNPCYICKNNFARIDPAGDHTIYECNQCDSYIVENIDPPVIDDYLRPIISGYVREYQNKRTRIKLTHDLVEKIKRIPTLSLDEKIIRLMRWIESRTKFPGDHVAIDTRPFTDTPELIAICYAKNIEEVEYFRRFLFLNKLIENDRGGDYTITVAGFNYLESKRKVIDSNLCFCAMSFSSEHNYIYNDFIEPAVTSAGYEIKRVDTDPHNSGIVDKIIALVRKSKFIIADLTGHKDGVYYEAGFAKGLGREVIFTCEKEYFNEGKGVHFDIRHLNHLIWSENELEVAKQHLSLRIEATLGKGSFHKKDT